MLQDTRSILWKRGASVDTDEQADVLSLRIHTSMCHLSDGNKDMI